MATALSSTNKASSIKLSNANLTATWSVLNKTIVADASSSSGKKYFEATCDNVGSTSMNWGIGFADPSIDCTVANIPAANGNARTSAWACSLSTAAASYIYVNDTAVQSNLTGFSNNTTRQVLGAAVDFAEKTIQFYLNGSAIGAAVDFSAHTGALVPAIWGNGVGAWNIITARFAAADLTYTPPAGYSAWDTVEAPPVVDKSWLMTLFNGAIKGIKGIAKSAIPFYDGEKWEVKEAGTPGQVLGIDDNGDLDWKTLTAGADLIEVADQASLPGVGAVKTIYLALDTNKLYYWKTNAYRELAPSVGGSSNITVGYTAPTDPEINHVWIDLNEGGIILTPEQVIPDALLVPPLPGLLVATLLTPPVTWNPDKIGNGMSLEGGNVTAVMSGANRNVLATTGKSSGKWYFEVKTIGSTAEQTYVGLGTENTNLNLYLGANAESWAYGWEGSAAYRFHNGFAAYGEQINVLDVIGVAVDLTAGSLSFYKNNVFLGVAYSSGVSGVIYPAVGGMATTNKIQGRFTAASFTYSPPAGYSAWDS